jgi:hypothetical protein
MGKANIVEDESGKIEGDEGLSNIRGRGASNPCGTDETLMLCNRRFEKAKVVCAK